MVREGVTQGEKSGFDDPRTRAFAGKACHGTVLFSHCCHSHCCRTFFAPMSHRTAGMTFALLSLRTVDPFALLAFALLASHWCRSHFCLSHSCRTSNRLRRRTSDQTVLGSNPAVAAALSPWTRLFTPIVPRRSLHISLC